MNYKKNYERFPDNIYDVEEKLIGDKHAKIYLAKFKSLYDLYEYLKSNPTINKNVFKALTSTLQSIEAAGKPYEEALEDLITNIDYGYEDFLKLQKDLNNKKEVNTYEYKTVKSVTGGYLSIPDYVAGNPFCFQREELITKQKFIKVYVSLFYNWTTTQSQILHRAIIITNILKALKNAGYDVDLNTFFLTKDDDKNYEEIIYIIVKLKSYGNKLNLQTLYKTLCCVEFNRRIILRVIETLDVKNNWAKAGYGFGCDEKFTRTILNLKENVLFMDQPQNMGILGNDLSEDFINAINHLNLHNIIDIEESKRKFTKTLK